MPLDGLRAAPRVEWRLGYLPQAELDRALWEATVALSRTAPSSTSRARSSRRSAAASLRSSTTSPASASRCDAYGAGRVVPAGDVEAMTEAARELLADADALAGARAGAERARAELTWDAAAAQHLALYRELA